MPLIKTVVKRPVAVTIIVAVVMILGYFTFSRLTVDFIEISADSGSNSEL